MRLLLIVLFSAITVFAEDPPAAIAQLPQNLTIPARLLKTIDTNKCKAGDTVLMRTLEPVLLGNGLVMPEDAKLHGMIAGAASRQNDRPSWIVLVVERAEWKKHSIPLRAFIASQITFTAKTPGPIESASDALSDAERAPYAGSSRSTPRSLRTVGPPPSDATGGTNGPSRMSYPKLDEVYVQQARNGAVFLLSPKPHLRLPSGTMFMLRNESSTAARPAGTGKATGTAH